MPNSPTLEVCCGSLQSAINAVAGGAERIELCSALEVDGLTPLIEVLRELRQRFPSLKIHVLIRPREGDFVYSEAEIAQMERLTIIERMESWFPEWDGASHAYEIGNIVSYEYVLYRCVQAHTSQQT